MTDPTNADRGSKNDQYNRLIKLMELYELEGNEKGKTRVEFDAWCCVNERDPNENGGDRLKAFILQKELETWSIDPPNFPGLNHAAAYCLCNDLDRPSHFDDLSPQDQTTLRGWLNAKYANTYMGDRFEIGKTVGGRWKVTSKLTDVDGCFNRGILLVEDEYEHDRLTKSKAIMKLLPSKAMHPQYARREIDILTVLKHDNIVALFDSDKPHHRHGTPWTVTEYCDLKTLEDIFCLYENKGKLVPEKFLWQVFVSLAEAVNYCHNGNPGCDKWDSISHRDITASNVFVKSNLANTPDEYPITIKLGDFGCSITDSEWAERTRMPLQLAIVDPSYEPPETALPIEASDIWEIGAVLAHFFEELPASNAKPGDRWPDTNKYSQALEDLISVCLQTDPNSRPSAGELVISTRRARASLIANGILQHETLLLP